MVGGICGRSLETQPEVVACGANPGDVHEAVDTEVQVGAVVLRVEGRRTIGVRFSVFEGNRHVEGVAPVPRGGIAIQIRVSNRY